MNTVVIDTYSGLWEVIIEDNRHRITFDTKAIRSRLQKRKAPFNLPEDLEAIKTPAVDGGFVFKICKKHKTEQP